VSGPDDPAARESDLVARWRSGDVSAFEEIVRTYRRRLFAVALRTTGNVARAEDSLQVALHNAFRGIAHVNGDLDLGPWLAAIVRNAAINESRSEARHARLARTSAEGADSREDHPGNGAPADGSLDRLEQLELGRILTQGLETLPAPYRRALELYHVQGLPVAEIARVLEMNVATVKTHLARGRAQLHRRLERRLREGGYL
jgi:RNA polymerase sigma-70 factor, ECF subfamily